MRMTNTTMYPNGMRHQLFDLKREVIVHRSSRKAEFLLFIKCETLRNHRTTLKHRECEPAGEWTSESKWVQ